MSYHHNSTFYKNKSRARKLNKFAFVFVTLVLIGGGIIVYDWYQSVKSETKSVVSKENTSSVQSASISLYRTEYFQFQAPEEWVAVADQPPNKFTFYKKRKGKNTHRLVVYANRTAKIQEADMPITSVVPIELEEDGTFTNLGEISDHCGKSWPENAMRNPGRIKHAGVEFICTPDSQEYNVVIGQYDKNEVIEKTQSDGSKISLTIVYSDLTAYPGIGDLFTILSSFTIF